MRRQYRTDFGLSQSNKGEIDLHGETQSQAFTIVRSAIYKAHAEGKKSLRIITGKSGVLNEKLPLWLEAEQFENEVRETKFDRLNPGTLIVYIKKDIS